MLLLKPALHHPQLLKTASQKCTESSNDQVQFTVTHFQHLALASTMESHPLGGRRALFLKNPNNEKTKKSFQTYISSALLKVLRLHLFSFYVPNWEHLFTRPTAQWQPNRETKACADRTSTNKCVIIERNEKYKNAFIHSSMKIRASNQQVSAEKQHKFSVIMEEPLVCASRQNNAVNGMIIS